MVLPYNSAVPCTAFNYHTLFSQKWTDHIIFQKLSTNFKNVHVQFCFSKETFLALELKKFVYEIKTKFRVCHVQKMTCFEVERSNFIQRRW